MTAQLSLLLGPPELEPVEWGQSRKLPLLRAVPELVEAPRPTGSVMVNGRLRAAVTMPGYHAGRVPPSRGRTYPPEPLTKGEVLRLLDACGHGFTGVRNRALFTVLWRTGLRIDEALSLLPKDLNFDEARATVLRGKGRKRRVVGLDAQTIEVLSVWLAKREGLPVGRQHPVFCVVQKPTVGGKLYQSCVRESMQTVAERAGIERRCRPHQLRHTYATELAREGVPINVISRLLGHSNSGTTARYIDHLAPEEALAVAQARSWLVAA